MIYLFSCWMPVTTLSGESVSESVNEVSESVKSVSESVSLVSELIREVVSE